MIINKSDQLNELATALSLVQLEIENASKNAANPHLKSRYANLESILAEIRPTLSKHGLSLAQFPSYADGIANISSILMHKSGQFLEGMISCKLDARNDNAQGVGSAITYLRRYSAAAIVGITQDDDDGHSVSKTQNADKPAKKPATEKKPLDQKRLNDAICKIKKGESNGWDKEKLLSTFDLTLDQIKQVNDILGDNSESSIDEAAF